MLIGTRVLPLLAWQPRGMVTVKACADVPCRAGDLIRDCIDPGLVPRTRVEHGGHIVIRQICNNACIFRDPDGRVTFAIPFETDFTLIGTTDRDHHGSLVDAPCTREKAGHPC